ncbi:MAG: 50S ribosome-binding GTPase [Clostridiales bacterium]|jgi:sulfate adenylyltransferase large subunit|nr:50S ribosome-binding GTPase [Clostridiales bacterium]
MSDNKIKIVFVGHVDHGKSTLIGRLLYNTHSIAEDKIKDLEKNTPEGKKLDFSFLMDHFEEERKQGITIDTAQIFFRTSKRDYVIIDAPGHVEFVVNMITGAAQADAAVLIVDVAEGIQEQTKRHAYILSMLGIKQVIVAVNKIDLVDYNEEKYNAIMTDLSSFLPEINIHNVTSVPISSTDGDNITEHSEKTKWFTGRTFIELIDDISGGTDESKQCAVLPIQDVYNINDQGKSKRIFVGMVEAGTIVEGQNVCVLPTNEQTRVKSIEKYNEVKTKVENGECIGITTEKPLFIERGSIVCSINHNLNVTATFKASLFWMSTFAINVNDKLVLRCSTQEVGCSVSEIFKKINSSTLEKIEDSLTSLNKLEVGEVEIRTKKPVVISTISDVQALGRFVLLRDNTIVAGGIVAE